MSGTAFDLSQKEKEKNTLKKEMASPSFWDNENKAAIKSKRLSILEKELALIQEIEHQIKDWKEMDTLIQKEKTHDEELVTDHHKQVIQLKDKIDDFEISTLLNGSHDEGNAIVLLKAGAGGVDAQDWNEILARMYTRFFEKMDFSYQCLEASPGDEAGLKSVMYQVKGDYAYGLLSAENGIHRLVRLSPFNANNKRHTSFAAVEVIPEIEGDIAIEIKDEDLRIDTYRASGAGGQHINKTDSAVRITHIPSGTVVQCQNSRSQTMNKDTAMKILKSKLITLEEEKKEKEISLARGEQSDIGWGSQIRSYVFHPYQMVKDHRTKEETENLQSVLDGDMYKFIKSYLLFKRKKK
ncbi:peptide chain release factor 2 [Candidatus Margulisiibacteriota bacterium]